MTMLNIVVVRPHRPVELARGGGIRGRGTNSYDPPPPRARLSRSRPPFHPVVGTDTVPVRVSSIRRSSPGPAGWRRPGEESWPTRADRKSTRLNSSHVKISYAVFCLKKKKERRSRG